MKKLYLVGIMVLVFAGCSDFLDEQPESFSNADTFYNSPSGIQEGINGAYHSLQVLYDVK